MDIALYNLTAYCWRCGWNVDKHPEDCEFESFATKEAKALALAGVRSGL